MLLAYCEGAEFEDLCPSWASLARMLNVVSMLAYRGLLSPRDDRPMITNTGFQEADALVAGQRQVAKHIAG
ncbi:MAG: hypothetical protein ACYDD1_18775 [Caulobacteraceae bacterium]